MALMGLLAGSGNLRAAADLSLPITGDLLGTVLDAAGQPQMGAAVQVFNKYQRVVSHTLTDSAGRFAFIGLASENYSVRVSLDSFLPASRDQVLVKPGFDSVLEIHLATLLSNIQVSYRAPTGAMSDDWKWVLRSSPATRMVTRALPVDFPQDEPNMHPRVFSDTHAMFAVSGGDGGLIDTNDMTADLGTSFAVSTNVFGKNQLQVAGALGQNAEFGPSAIALCAIYSRTSDGPLGAPPEVTFTMAQLGGLSSSLNGSGLNPSAMGALPFLRTMSLGLYEVLDPLDNVHLEYGVTGESVELAQHISRISPFARATVDLHAAGAIVASYSDGGRPNELISHQQFQPAELDADSDLSEPAGSLSRLPQITQRNGRVELQRTESYEVGYRKVDGASTYAVSGFHEAVTNGSLNVTGDLGGLEPGDLFADGVSTTTSYNVGRYSRSGYLASVDQHLRDSFDVAIAYGRLGGFGATPSGIDTETLVSANRFLTEQQHNFASFSGRTVLPHVGTLISANYGWTDPRAAIPRHLFTTQDAVADPGLNIRLRQPLPSFHGIPGRLELTADLRNLLATGYAPVNTGDGRRLLIVEAPRAIRGGLKITF